MEQKKKIIITGGSGFIGTNVIQYFLDKYEIINIDNTKPKEKLHEIFWNDVDITDYKRLRKVILDFNPDYIIHLAARTDLDGSSIADYEANTIGVTNIMKAAKELKTLKKIIITSSMLVCKPGYIPKNQIDYAPTTVYGESKVETENITWKLAQELKCDWCIIRPSSIWGEYFGIPYRNFFDMVLSKKYFHIGHKGCTKTYGYVGNAVYEIEQLLFHETYENNNKVFYIGDYIPTNIEEWADEISLQAFGKKIFHMPYFIIKCAALFGDFISIFKIHFPMTSFRLKNMTTNNIVPLENTEFIAPNLPYNRINAIHRTLEWLKKDQKKKE